MYTFLIIFDKNTCQLLRSINALEKYKNEPILWGFTKWKYNFQQINSSRIWLSQGIRTERNTFLLQERKNTIKHIKIQFNAPACYCAGNSFINLRGWFPSLFYLHFFFSNFPSWNNPIGARYISNLCSWTYFRSLDLWW